MKNSFLNIIVKLDCNRGLFEHNIDIDKINWKWKM